MNTRDARLDTWVGTGERLLDQHFARQERVVLAKLTGAKTRQRYEEKAATTAASRSAAARAAWVTRRAGGHRQGSLPHVSTGHVGGALDGFVAGRDLDALAQMRATTNVSAHHSRRQSWLGHDQGRQRLGDAASEWVGDLGDNNRYKPIRSGADFLAGKQRGRQGSPRTMTRAVAMMDAAKNGPVYPNLYRGMAVDDATLAKFQPGHTFTEALGSWSAARDYAVAFGSFRTKGQLHPSGNRNIVLFEMQDGRGVSVSPLATASTPGYLTAEEVVSSGQFQVVSVTQQRETPKWMTPSGLVHGQRNAPVTIVGVRQLARGFDTQQPGLLVKGLELDDDDVPSEPMYFPDEVYEGDGVEQVFDDESDIEPKTFTADVTVKAFDPRSFFDPTGFAARIAEDAFDWLMGIFADFGNALSLGLGGRFNKADPAVEQAARQQAERLSKVADSTFEAVSKVVLDGEAAGHSLDDIAAEVSRTFTNSRRVTVPMIAETEAAVAASSGEWMAANQTGLPLDKTWETRQDERVRPAHQRMQGVTEPLRTPFIVDGFPMDHPGDPTAPYALVVRCRCRLSYTPNVKARYLMPVWSGSRSTKAATTAGRSAAARRAWITRRGGAPVVHALVPHITVAGLGQIDATMLHPSTDANNNAAARVVASRFGTPASGEYTVAHNAYLAYLAAYPGLHSTARARAAHAVNLYTQTTAALQNPTPLTPHPTPPSVPQYVNVPGVGMIDYAGPSTPTNTTQQLRAPGARHVANMLATPGTPQWNVAHNAVLQSTGMNRGAQAIDARRAITTYNAIYAPSAPMPPPATNAVLPPVGSSQGAVSVPGLSNWVGTGPPPTVDPISASYATTRAASGSSQWNTIHNAVSDYRAQNPQASTAALSTVADDALTAYNAANPSTPAPTPSSPLPPPPASGTPPAHLATVSLSGLPPIPTTHLLTRAGNGPFTNGVSASRAASAAASPHSPEWNAAYNAWVLDFTASGNRVSADQSAKAAAATYRHALANSWRRSATPGSVAAAQAPPPAAPALSLFSTNSISYPGIGVISTNGRLKAPNVSIDQAADAAAAAHGQPGTPANTAAFNAYVMSAGGGNGGPLGHSQALTAANAAGTFAAATIHSAPAPAPPTLAGSVPATISLPGLPAISTTQMLPGIVSQTASMAADTAAGSTNQSSPQWIAAYNAYVTDYMRPGTHVSAAAAAAAAVALVNHQGAPNPPNPSAAPTPTPNVPNPPTAPTPPSTGPSAVVVPGVGQISLLQLDTPPNWTVQMAARTAMIRAGGAKSPAGVAAHNAYVASANQSYASYGGNHRTLTGGQRAAVTRKAKASAASAVAAVNSQGITTLPAGASSAAPNAAPAINPNLAPSVQAFQQMKLNNNGKTAGATTLTGNFRRPSFDQRFPNLAGYLDYGGIANPIRNPTGPAAGALVDIDREVDAEYQKLDAQSQALVDNFSDGLVPQGTIHDSDVKLAARATMIDALASGFYGGQAEREALAAASDVAGAQLPWLRQKASVPATAPGSAQVFSVGGNLAEYTYLRQFVLDPLDDQKAAAETLKVSQHIVASGVSHNAANRDAQLQALLGPTATPAPPLMSTNGLTKKQAGQLGLLTNTPGITAKQKAAINNAYVSSINQFQQQNPNASAGQKAAATKRAQASALAAAQQSGLGIGPGGTVGVVGSTGGHSTSVHVGVTTTTMDQPIPANPKVRAAPKYEDDIFGLMADPTIQAHITGRGTNGLSTVSKRTDGGVHAQIDLAAIYVAQGMNVLPDVVSDQEIDQSVAQGEIEWFRGMNSPGRGQTQPGADFRQGVYFAGSGIYGHGTYIAARSSVQNNHNVMVTRNNTGALQGAQGYGRHNVLRGTIKPDARWTTHSVLSKARSKIKADPRYRTMPAVYRQQIDDDGYLAAMLGYDVYVGTSNGGTGHDYLVLLNRGAVRVSTKGYGTHG